MTSLGFLFLWSLAILAQEPPHAFYDARVHENTKKERMPYRLYVPRNYDPEQRYPLVLWLHGSKGRGKDNTRQLRGANAWATAAFASGGNQAQFPAFIVAPQCPLKRTWDRTGGLELSKEQHLVVEILVQLQKEYSIDPQRIYIAGESMGGFGTWSLAIKRPDLFAAAVPLCGGGNPQFIDRLVGLPLWAFHGAADRTVSVRRSREMIAALRTAGGDPRYSEYPRVRHDVWKKAFTDPELLPWLFAQKKSGTEAVAASPQN
jgi:predicted peptidase